MHKGLINKLTGLLGFQHPQELAKMLDMPKNTADGFNTGRGSKYTLQAYSMLAKALEIIPEADRHKVLKDVPRKELSLSEKYQREGQLKKAIAELLPRIQGTLDKASSEFFVYNRLLERLKEIEKELKR